ncbi:MAG: diguanylate cyclase, partial [Syntrophobacteraceae bacterium]
LVITDIAMPGMNGVDLVREIRQKHPGIDSIVMTGFTADYTYSDIIQAGAADFIGKPFQMAELKAKIERVERERRILREIQKANAVLAVTLNRMHAIIEFLPDPTFVVDETGKVVAWNKAIEKMTGVSRADMLRKGNYEHAVPFYGERRPILIDFALSHTSEPEIEKYHYIQKEGNRLSAETYVPQMYGGKGAHIWATASVLRDGNGNVFGAIESIRDISEHKWEEEVLSRTADRLSLATKAGCIGIWDYDIAKNRRVWDDQMYRLYGITPDESCDAHEAWKKGVHPDDMQRIDQGIQTALRGEKEFNTEFRVVWPDGTMHNIRALAIVQRDASGQPLRMIGTNWDITAQKLAEDTLAHKATHDSLTGLLNRRAILDRLTEEISRIERCGGSLAVGICDVDLFKQVNDTYGHQTGDDVLCGLAQILSNNLRKYDSVGRIGGEEFLLITPVNDPADCSLIFTRLCTQVAESKITTRSGILAVTVSMGVACVAAGSTVGDILDAADTALYLAKSEGRNRVVHDKLLTPELEQRTIERVDKNS